MHPLALVIFVTELPATEGMVPGPEDGQNQAFVIQEKPMKLIKL